MFYDIVQDLCKRNHVSITKMALDIGLSNAAATSWKNGSVPRLETLQKIADYFGITIYDLMQQDVQKEADLTDFELEALRVLRQFDVRTKNKALTLLYELEDSLGQYGGKP